MAIPFVMINLDRPRKLRFGMGAMVEFEQMTGIKLTSLDDEISIETCAKILWVMLKQEEKDLTLDDVCNLIDDNADNVTDVINKVTEAIKAAFPQEKNGPKLLKSREVKPGGRWTSRLSLSLASVNLV